MVVFNVSDDSDYYADLTTIVRRESVEAATVTAAPPERLLSVDYPFALDNLSSTSPIFSAGNGTTTTTAATVAIDYAVRNVSVVLCHPSTGIPSVGEYFTGRWLPPIRRRNVYYNKSVVDRPTAVVRILSIVPAFFGSKFQRGTKINTRLLSNFFFFKFNVRFNTQVT